jgi:hypothetical protein
MPRSSPKVDLDNPILALLRPSEQRPGRTRTPGAILPHNAGTRHARQDRARRTRRTVESGDRAGARSVGNYIGWWHRAFPSCGVEGLRERNPERPAKETRQEDRGVVSVLVASPVARRQASLDRAPARSTISTTIEHGSGKTHVILGSVLGAATRTFLRINVAR